MRAHYPFVLALAAACQCSTRVSEREYVCATDSDCFAGFRCGPGGVCVSQAAAGGSGGASGGGAAAAGGANAGGADAGGGEAGGAATAGGSSAGGSSTAGGGTAGGGTAGGATAGGGRAGGGAAGGATAGGGTAGGGAAGGATAGGCAVYVSAIGNTQARVRASVVEVAARPRVLWSSTAGAFYSECNSNCGTATPTWAAPVTLGPGDTGRDTRPLLREQAGTLSAVWRGPGSALFSECPGNCTSAASWTAPVDLSVGQTNGHTLAYDVLGNLRVAAYEDGTVGAADGGGLTYLECASGCTTSAASWRPALWLPHNPSGNDLRLRPLSDGGVRRHAAHFADEINSIRYGECEANCLSTGWSFVSLGGNAKDPFIVFDAAGLPRIFALNTSTDRVYTFRCAQLPCTTQTNWVSTNLIAGGHITGGNFPNGSTYFVTSQADAGALLLGVESGTTYTTSTINLCSGASLPGERPHAYSGPGNRLRLVFVTPPAAPAINFLYQAP